MNRLPVVEMKDFLALLGYVAPNQGGDCPWELVDGEDQVGTLNEDFDTKDTILILRDSYVESGKETKITDVVSQTYKLSRVCSIGGDTYYKVYGK